MKKDVLISTVAILALLGLVFYGATKPSPAKAPIEESSLPDSKYVESAEYYDIVTNYPSRLGAIDAADASSTPLLSKVSKEADAKAIAIMKSFVSDTIAQFKTDGNFAHLTHTDVKTLGLGPDRKEKLQITYLIASSAHTQSYIFTVYTDTLGAHGNISFKTFTFNTDPSMSSGQAGSALALSDLFQQGNYFDTLSSLARAKLPANIGENANTNMIIDGTKPESASFENFFFDNKDFVILFAPYQVAPYSAGPQTLRINTSELSNLLKPTYR